jgi:hypothetical protein
MRVILGAFLHPRLFPGDLREDYTTFSTIPSGKGCTYWPYLHQPPSAFTLFFLIISIEIPTALYSLCQDNFLTSEKKEIIMHVERPQCRRTPLYCMSLCTSQLYQEA